jgi:hypothetical protein
MAYKLHRNKKKDDWKKNEESKVLGLTTTEKNR